MVTHIIPSPTAKRLDEAVFAEIGLPTGMLTSSTFEQYDNEYVTIRWEGTARITAKRFNELLQEAQEPHPEVPC